jgi:hypothetical protein
VAIGSRTHLTLYLTGGYLLLIVYASLYPWPAGATAAAIRWTS